MLTVEGEYRGSSFEDVEASIAESSSSSFPTESSVHSKAVCLPFLWKLSLTKQNRVSIH